MTGLRVFAVEDTSAQVCWRRLPPGAVLEAGDAAVVVDEDGPGATSLPGLPPATPLDVTLQAPGQGRRRVGRFRTLEPPPGRLLGRFATVNDIHIGERRFGLLRRIRERPLAGLDPYPLRCARAALEEAVAWGAEAVVVKGDLTYNGRSNQWEHAARLLAGVPVPVHAVLGNHDVGRMAVDGSPVLTAAGVAVADEETCVEVAGIHLVLVPTAVPLRSGSRVLGGQRRRVADLVGSAGGPVFMAMHHYPQMAPWQVFFPPGIPAAQARPLLDAVAAANPATFVSVGHSHRHRRHRHGPVVVTEIGATMHYPGTWAGYAVHEGGIRQVVRRVAAPEALAWTERTGRALLGGWALWASGRRGDRCFSHSWPGA